MNAHNDQQSRICRIRWTAQFELDKADAVSARRRGVELQPWGSCSHPCDSVANALVRALNMQNSHGMGEYGACS